MVNKEGEFIKSPNYLLGRAKEKRYHGEKSAHNLSIICRLVSVAMRILGVWEELTEAWFVCIVCIGCICLDFLHCAFSHWHPWECGKTWPRPDLSQHWDATGQTVPVQYHSTSSSSSSSSSSETQLDKHCLGLCNVCSIPSVIFFVVSIVFLIIFYHISSKKYVTILRRNWTNTAYVMSFNIFFIRISILFLIIIGIVSIISMGLPSKSMSAS